MYIKEIYDVYQEVNKYISHNHIMSINKHNIRYIP